MEDGGEGGEETVVCGVDCEGDKAADVGDEKGGKTTVVAVGAAVEAVEAVTNVEVKGAGAGGRGGGGGGGAAPTAMDVEGKE